jgi:hypothetical protein
MQIFKLSVWENVTQVSRKNCSVGEELSYSHLDCAVRCVAFIRCNAYAFDGKENKCLPLEIEFLMPKAGIAGMSTGAAVKPRPRPTGCEKVPGQRDTDDKVQASFVA